MKKLTLSILALTLLTTVILAVPVHAVTYTVTMKLYKDGELIWTSTSTIEAPESPITIKVPQQLYDRIIAEFGTDTFSTPFTWEFTADGHAFLLEITSDPVVTIIFEPCLPGDANGDGKINIFDVGLVSAHWYPGPPVGLLGYDLYADMFFDGEVDIFDIAQVSANWGMGALAVP